ncbi:hypothetical protein BDZ89DRAFT_752175 [Hymenopellis radicata]|nr:hypothetical protein BDZ89DRAFT_752175 [Hymenopellis radicata]
MVCLLDAAVVMLLSSDMCRLTVLLSIVPLPYIFAARLISLAYCVCFGIRHVRDDDMGGRTGGLGLRNTVGVDEQA